jgi:hypothetical protein
MKKAVAQFVERFRWLPLFVFPGGAIVVFLLIYRSEYQSGAVGLAVVLASFFLVYLLGRPSQVSSIGSVGPAVVGPWATKLYVDAHSPHLSQSLDGDGAVLIQLAFFFASLIGFIVQVLLMIGQKDEAGWKKQLFAVLVFVVLLLLGFLPELTPQGTPAGPPITAGIHAPPWYGLTWCRMLLGLASLLLATIPSPRVVARPAALAVPGAEA